MPYAKYDDKCIKNSLFITNYKNIPNRLINDLKFNSFNSSTLFAKKERKTHIKILI